ncbi:PTS sugar transporter subunit IIA [[Clostridium] innocuum]|nr:PTS sugar transporter subunit IIA [[Clostridium] innocuum]MCR0575386.1 PTS sugar transporter subunit IIA [[Clostridium] innocuum]
MYIKDILKPENVEVIESVIDWRDAVYQGTKNLEAQNYITRQYSEAIIENLLTYGAYFVLCPGIALLHATSNAGVLKTQLSVVLVKRPFRFKGKDEDIKLLITLAAIDSQSHIGAMQQIAMLLNDDKTIDNVLQMTSTNEIYKTFTSVLVE